MPVKCPHCSEEIDKLPGFVPEATMRERLKTQGEAKDAEIGALTTEVKDLRGKASTFDAVLAERDQFKGEIEGMKQRETRLGELDKHKLDRGLLEHVEVLYTSATAGQDAPQAFGAWLEEHGKTHALLAPHFGQASSTPAPTTPTTPNPGPNVDPASTPAPPRTAPTETPSEPPPGPGGKMSPDDLRRYFGSPEFQAMKPEEKRAKIAELKTQVQNPSASS